MKPKAKSEKGTIQNDQCTFFSRTYISVTRPKAAMSPAATIPQVT